MRIKLPPSLDRRVHTVEDEVAFAKSLTLEQRLEVVALVCRAAIQVLQLNPLREQVMAARDPLPVSTIAALRRLRTAR